MFLPFRFLARTWSPAQRKWEAIGMVDLSIIIHTLRVGHMVTQNKVDDIGRGVMTVELANNSILW